MSVTQNASLLRRDILSGLILNLEELLSIPRVSLTPVPPEDGALQGLFCWGGWAPERTRSLNKTTDTDRPISWRSAGPRLLHTRTHTHAHTHLPPLVNPPLSLSLGSHHGGNQNGNLR